MRRRDFFSGAAAAALALPAAGFASASPNKNGPIEVGSRRQLFLDDLRFHKQENVQLTLHSPSPREIVIRGKDHSWEPGGRGLHYPCVLKDGDLFRMWYRVGLGQDAD